MSERRKQSRVRVELRVEVSGKDASSETFSQSAVATNLSRSGALLSGMAAVLRCGDLLSVSTASGRQSSGLSGYWIAERTTVSRSLCIAWQSRRVLGRLF